MADKKKKEPTVEEQLQANREAAAKALAEAGPETVVDVPIEDVTRRPQVSLSDREAFPSVKDVPVDSPSIATQTDRITAEHAARAAEDTVQDQSTGALTVANPETDILADPAAHPDVLRVSGALVSEGPPAREEEPPAEDTAEKGAVTFESDRYPSMVVFGQDGSRVGQFQGGKLTTSDPAAIAVLDGTEGVKRA